MYSWLTWLSIGNSVGRRHCPLPRRKIPAIQQKKVRLLINRQHRIHRRKSSEDRFMRKIEAVVEPFKFDEIIEALKKENIQRVTVFEVKGAGSRQGRVKIGRA